MYVSLLLDCLAGTCVLGFNLSMGASLVTYSMLFHIHSTSWIYLVELLQSFKYYCLLVYQGYINIGVATKRLKRATPEEGQGPFGGSQSEDGERELMFEGAEMEAAEEVALILGQLYSLLWHSVVILDEEDSCSFCVGQHLSRLLLTL